MVPNLILRWDQPRSAAWTMKDCIRCMLSWTAHHSSSSFSYSPSPRHSCPQPCQIYMLMLSDVVTIPKRLGWYKCATRGQVEHSTTKQYPELGSENPSVQRADRAAARNVATGRGDGPMWVESGVNPVNLRGVSSSQQNGVWRLCQVVWSLSILLMPSTG